VAEDCCQQSSQTAACFGSRAAVSHCLTPQVTPLVRHSHHKGTNPLRPPHPPTAPTHRTPQDLVTPQRVTVGWFQPSSPALFAPDRLPVWLLQMPGEKPLYGFPTFGAEPGFKLGAFAADDAPPLDPDDASERSWRGGGGGGDDEAPLRAALRRFFPDAAGGAFLGGGVCMFANTPDSHFIVDAHPRHPQVGFLVQISGVGLVRAGGRAVQAAHVNTKTNTNTNINTQTHKHQHKQPTGDPLLRLQRPRLQAVPCDRTGSGRDGAARDGAAV